MSVCKSLRIRWVQFAKTWGHVSSVSIIGNIFVGLKEMLVMVAHVLSIYGIVVYVVD